MTRTMLFPSVLVLAGTAAADFNGPYMLDNWVGWAIPDGMTALSTNPGEVEFSYDVNLGIPGPGVTLRTATFSAPAAATGLVTFDWHWTGSHAVFMSDGVLQVFADEPGGNNVLTLYSGDVDTVFDLSGSASIPVTAGYNWGIIVGGHNFDSTSVLNGTVRLSNLEGRARDFTGAYAMENWLTSGIEGGTTEIEPATCVTGSAAFSYDVNLGIPGPGVTFRTTSFSAPAQASGLATFDWNWTGFHAYALPWGFLEVFADGPGGTSSITLYDGAVGVPFDLSGSASINVAAGYDWGIIVGGSNFDSSSQINGTVTVSNLVAPHLGFNGPYGLLRWSNTGIMGGTTDQVSAGLDLASASADISYDVDLGVPGGGVSLRTTTLGVSTAETGTVTFDYSWTGFHAWFLATGLLQVVADGPSGTTTVNLYDGVVYDFFTICGSASIDVTAGYNWGITVGGSNNDSTSLMRGTVTMSNLRQCPLDLDGDGLSDCQPNDDCADALVIAEGDAPFSTINSTSDGPPVCDEGINTLLEADVWFRYTPDLDGVLTVSTCGQADYDTRLVAYLGGCGGLEVAACNDDAPGCAGATSVMEVPVSGGQELLIRAGSRDGSTGSGTLTVAFALPCPWDCDASGDGNVNVTDLLALLGQYDPLAPNVCDGGEPCDYDGNGCVDVTDLLKLLAHYTVDPLGIGCP